MSYINGLPENEVKQPLWRDRLQLVRALAQFRIGDVEAAQASFHRVRERTSDLELLKIAAFNQIVTALELGPSETTDAAIATLQTVSEAAVEDLRIGEARFRRAVLVAQGTDSGGSADAAFEEFLSEHSRHARSRQALIMRIELALSDSPPQNLKAGQLLAHLERQGSLSDREQYLKVWRAVGEGGDAFDRALEANSTTETSFSGHVALRGAERFLAEGNLEMLSERLGSLSRDFTGDADFVLQVEFLKAYLTQHSGKPSAAVKEWSQLMGRTKGEPHLVARHQQALAYCQQSGDRLANLRDARAQWDEILRLEPKPELRLRALMAKGESLTQLAEEDGTYAVRALEVFNEILAIPEADEDWLDQALYRKGIVLLRMGKRVEALAAFNQVVRRYQERVAMLPEGVARPPMTGSTGQVLKP